MDRLRIAQPFSLMESRISGVLLAAGASRRFGSNKLLYPLLDDGLPIIEQALKKLLLAVDEVIVVVPEGADKLEEIVRSYPCEVSICTEADKGMGHSLAWGVRQTSHASGWLIALGDMPGIQSKTLRRLSDALRSGSHLLAPICQGRQGHPVGFSRQYYDRLISLTGDQGARQLLLDSKGKLQRILTDDCGVLWDIDIHEDLLDRQ